MGARLSRRQFLAAASATGALAACAPGAAPAAPVAEKPVRGGTLTYATAAEIGTLDPHTSNNLNEIAIERPIYETLARLNADMELKPGLALSWTQAGKTWTFKLRPGVKFHDGTPFNAAAVKANVDRLLNPTDKPLQGAKWSVPVEKVEVVDEMTVRYTTKAVNPFFPLLVADGSGFIMSPAALQKYGKEMSRNAVGTGPFKLAEWVKDDRLVVVRNDDYWGDKAYLDKVVFRATPETNARLVAIDSGDVQMAIRANPEDVERLQKDPKIYLSIKPTTRHLFLGMAFMKKPFSDLRVRQALNHAVDKEAICKSIYAGTADPQPHSVPPGALGYAPAPIFKYDPALAKRLLADAGYPNGFTVKLTATKGAYLKDQELDQAVQQYFKAVGVTMDIETVEFTKYNEVLRENPRTSKLEMWQEAGAGTDASTAVLNRYACDRFRPVGSNTHGYCDPVMDKLATDAIAIEDEAKRNAMLKEAQERIAMQAPSIWLVLLKEAAVLSKKVHEPVHYRDSVLTVDEHTWMSP